VPDEVPPDAPTIPEERLRGEDWERTETTTRKRRFGASAATESTVVYADERLREAVAAATGDDRTWRFFFASSLVFDPPLPPVTGTSGAFPTVAREARNAFESDLKRRGIRDLDRRRRERVRVDSGDRASLYPYRGRLADVDADVAAWLAVWTTDREFRLAGGGYPERLPGDVDADPTEYRETLLDLVRAVR
jgi:hypothetical protein